MNAYMKRNGNGFTSLHVELMQNIINMYFLKNKKDFTNLVTFYLPKQYSMLLLFIH